MRQRQTNNIVQLLLALAVALTLGACGADAHTGGMGESASKSSWGGSADASSGMAASGSSSGGGFSGSSGGSSSGSPGQSNGGAKAGVLTAGDWDDNLNWGWFQKYLDKALKQNKGFPDLKASKQILVTVQDKTLNPQKGAKLAFYVGKKKVHETTTGSDGRAVLLPVRDSEAATPTTVEVTTVDGKTETFPAQKGDTWSLHTETSAPTKTTLDVAFVVDTTGSMADELAWLKKEIAALADNVIKAYPNLDVRWAVVLYRDKGQGEAYLTKVLPFTSSAKEMKANLAKEGAGGGGDTPEALDKGLIEATKLKWRGGATTKLTFLIADAPAHAQDEAGGLLAVENLRRNGVRIYPLAASGAMGRAELFMRAAAMLTGGRYMFLTDHSGVGNKHAEPHIPCYLVQHLTKLVGRVITNELQGAWGLPLKDDIITTVGDPKSGVCTYDSGEQYFIM